MEYRELGQTGMNVSRLCFGALTIGPLQAHLPLREGAAVIRAALERGVNFIDTAASYDTYPYIREALSGWREEVWVASKSYDYTAEGMRQSVETGLRATGLGQFGLFMLHEQETRLTLAGHRPALEYLLQAKEKGIIRAVGVSTHAVEVVEAVAEMPEVDVVHPLLNSDGIGILDGGRDDMVRAVARAKAAGKGVYGMKPLGGGNLLGRAPEAFAFVLGNSDLDAVAVGMQSTDEVALNAALFSGEPVPPAMWDAVRRAPRRLHIEDWCIGCGACAARCAQGALAVVDGRAVVDPARCVLCGYCSAVCRDFCIKVI
ncbi:MAG: aldo/keto reductase [bacterium]|jgi:predicted aldo/keto reductase-like oxidoreductase